MIRTGFWMVAALAIVAGLGCSREQSPTSPTSKGAVDSSNLKTATTTGVVTVVHGVPGLTVDVYVNAALTLPSFLPGTVTSPLTLPEGPYDIAILPAGGTFPNDTVISGSALLPAGANVSIVAHLTESGAPTLSVFANDVSPTPGLRTRVVVRHLAEAPTVDVRLFRRILPNWPVRLIEDLSNPNEAQTQLFPGWFRAKLYPANSPVPVFTSPYLTLLPRESTIVYAIGSLSGGTFGLLVQKISLGNDKSMTGTTQGVPSTLSADEYDAIAVERNADND